MLEWTGGIQAVSFTVVLCVRARACCVCVCNECVLLCALFSRIDKVPLLAFKSDDIHKNGYSAVIFALCIWFT